MKLSYNSPLEAVFLRTLAWETYVAEANLSVGDVKAEQLSTARDELGLPALEPSGGAADDFLQKLRRGPHPRLSQRGTLPKPAEPDWRTEWRLLYLPSHRYVRQLSSTPIVRREPRWPGAPDDHVFHLTLRDPAMPALNIWVASDPTAGSGCAQRPGLYFIRHADSLYIGETTEFQVRVKQHWNTRTCWWMFASPADEQGGMPAEAFAAAEAFLICYWNEVCRIKNQKRGSDSQPGSVNLQLAVILCAAVSAALLWLIRDPDLAQEFPNWSIPFKIWSGRDWPECYLAVPHDRSESR